MPTDYLIKKLVIKIGVGFYNNSSGQWSPYIIKYLIHLSDFKILNYFYAWWWKISFYYKFCCNNFKLTKIYFLLKYSCIKRLIFKHNKTLKSFTKIFCIYKSNVVVIYLNYVFIWFNCFKFFCQNFFNLNKFSSPLCFNGLLSIKKRRLLVCFNCKKGENIFFYGGVLCFSCYKVLFLIKSSTT